MIVIPAICHSRESRNPAGHDAAALAGAFNRGFGDYALTYRTCTSNATEVIAHYLEESGHIARDIAGRYGG